MIRRLAMLTLLLIPAPMSVTAADSGPAALQIAEATSDGNRTENLPGARTAEPHISACRNNFFWIGAVILAAGLLATALHWRITILKRHEQELKAKVDKKTAELKTLVKLIGRINEGHRLSEVLDFVYESFRPLIPYERIGFAALLEDGETLQAEWARSNGEYPEVPIGYRAPISGSSLEGVIRRGEPRIIEDLEAYLQEHPASDATRRLVQTGLRSNLTCPLQSGGRIIGCLFFTTSTAGIYTGEHILFLQSIAGVLSTIVEKSRIYSKLLETRERLEEEVRTDFLTGLLNRRAMLDEVATEVDRFRRKGVPFCVVMGDIDHFKRINDLHGHDVGDLVLKRVADILRSRIRNQDRAARWGGEEFLFFLPETEQGGAMLLTEELRTRIEALKEQASGKTIEVTMSFGVTCFEKDDSVDSCISRADGALLRAKRDGRNRVVAAKAGEQQED